MKYKITISGLGGQSVMLAGKIIARAAKLDGCKTVWLPLPVSELRGNGASCKIIISKEPYYSAYDGGILIAADEQALHRFRDEKDGLTITDEKYEKLCAGKRVICLNTEICSCGGALAGLNNLVMIGAMLTGTDIITPENIYRALREQLGCDRAEKAERAVEYGIKRAHKKAGEADDNHLCSAAYK